MAYTKKNPSFSDGRRGGGDRFYSKYDQKGSGRGRDREGSEESFRGGKAGYRSDRTDGKPGYRSDRDEYRSDRKPGVRPKRDGYRPDGKSGYRSERDGYRPERTNGSFGVRPARPDAPRRSPVPDRPVEKPERISFQDYEYAAKPESPMIREEESIPAEEYILTGRNPIREALKQNRDLEKLLVQKGELSGSAREIVQIAKERKILVQTVEKSRLDEIARQHQGLIAFASAYQYAAVEEILQVAKERGEDPFIVLLDGITDPHNLGAIIRTAECAGAHGVIVPQHRSVGLTPAAVKASAGAVEYVKVARVANLNRTIEELKKKNIWIYAVTMNGKDYRQLSFKGGIGLVIGAEGDGISRLTEELCDDAVSLPMKGHLDSLNASVAAGIILYHAMEAR